MIPDNIVLTKQPAHHGPGQANPGHPHQGGEAVVGGGDDSFGQAG